MTYENKQFLDSKMGILQGAKCIKIGRSCNLMWIHFSVKNSIYILDTQSAFRFSTDREILCTNLDMYEPRKIHQNDSDFDYENFNWDVQGENAFDEWVTLYLAQSKEPCVSQIFISDYGDLSITFDNGIKLEIFNNSLNECWRFFCEHSQGHIVVNGNTVE